MKVPPVFTYGRQYSDKVARLDTALDTQRSYFSRYSLFLAYSSALPWIALMFVRPSRVKVSSRKFTLFFSESRRQASRCGNAIFNGIPGIRLVMLEKKL